MTTSHEAIKRGELVVVRLGRYCFVEAAVLVYSPATQGFFVSGMEECFAPKFATIFPPTSSEVGYWTPYKFIKVEWYHKFSARQTAPQTRASAEATRMQIDPFSRVRNGREDPQVQGEDPPKVNHGQEVLCEG